VMVVPSWTAAGGSVRSRSLPTPHEPLAQDDEFPGRGEEDHEQRQKEQATHCISSGEMVCRLDTKSGRVKKVSRLKGWQVKTVSRCEPNRWPSRHSGGPAGGVGRTSRRQTGSCPPLWRCRGPACRSSARPCPPPGPGRPPRPSPPAPGSAPPVPATTGGRISSAAGPPSASRIGGLGDARKSPGSTDPGAACALRAACGRQRSDPRRPSSGGEGGGRIAPACGGGGGGAGGGGGGGQPRRPPRSAPRQRLLTR